jgi:hypothetical protein
MIPFEIFFETYNQREYKPRPNDVFFHGSLKDFDLKDIQNSEGLIYLSRNFHHHKNQSPFILV